jgi:hypothetical protein
MTHDSAVADAVPPAYEVALAEAAVPPARLAPEQAIEAWDQAKRQLAVLLREAAPDAAWVTQFGAVAARQRELARRDPDVALYLLLQTAGSDLDRYSAHHAMLCAVICDLCAAGARWPAEEADALWHAALSMNLALTVTQDSLARQDGPLSAAQRDEVAGHADASARLLADAGVDDALWLDIVRHHHRARAADAAAPAERLAGLLHRVDVYTAKLSRRATREPTTPTIAAREACLGAAGQPDALGALLLRSVGLYPPGCFVQLDNGELGLVVGRGPKAHTPVVAVLRRADGGLCLQPQRRDTTLARFGVKRGVNAQAVRVHVNHLRTLAVNHLRVSAA